jgi:hypothetical protein
VPLQRGPKAERVAAAEVGVGDLDEVLAQLDGQLGDVPAGW